MFSSRSDAQGPTFSFPSAREARYASAFFSESFASFFVSCSSTIYSTS